MADKNFEPEVMPETPFPGEPEVATLGSQPNPAGTFTPTQVKEKTFPKKRTAVELLSTALNTRSRKILEEFELQQSGGFQIGNFKSGISGDLRLTPNGMTARNKSGITTLAVDGDTGDAIFKGRISAGSIMTEGEIVDENGVTIIDSEGLVSTANFANGTVTLDAQITRTASGWGDATGLSLTFTLAREANVLILATLSGKNTSLTSSGGEQFIRFDINGTPTNAWGLHGTPGGGGLEAESTTIHYLATLPAGSNTIKVQHRWAVLGDAILVGTTGTDLAGSRLSYIVLGK